jgi:hypothetical protein
VPPLKEEEAAGNSSDEDVDQQLQIELAGGDRLPYDPLPNVPLPDLPLSPMFLSLMSLSPMRDRIAWWARSEPALTLQRMEWLLRSG